MPRTAKQVQTKSPPPLYLQRARERRRAMAVSGAAMLVIVATLATIVFMRSNDNRADEIFTTAEAAPAEEPAAKPVKTQSVKKPTTAAAAPPAPQAVPAKPAAPANPPAQQLAAAAPQEIQEGDGGPAPIPVDVAAAQPQAFANVQETASNASKLLSDVAGGNLPPELVSVVPTPRPADASSKPPVQEEVKTAGAAEAADATNTARILRDVTMRASGAKGAEQIGTIPARATVELITCKSWCQVVYKGKRGWIYKSFVDR